MKRKNISSPQLAERASAAPTAPGSIPKTPLGAKRAALDFQRILVPVDFSGFSERALEYAVPLAEQFHASLVLLHVVEVQIYQESLLVGSKLEDVNVKQMRLCREKIDALARRHIGPHVPSQTAVRVGKPYFEIVAAAREFDIDLIVIATHGYTGLMHLFLGSNAERVVRLAPCPVLTVQEKEQKPAAPDV